MENETKTYEIGYLLSPLVPDEKLDGEISALRGLIESQKCLIMGEERARIRKLAYTVQKKGSGRFDTAYFGWIKFVADPAAIAEIKGGFDKEANILRFLILDITKNESVKKTAKKPSKPVGFRKKTVPGAEVAIKTEIKPEEIDKKIEELLGA
ncbi:MAG: 30S ribosomal protein S6 [bacterium]|nr:30S ribosomal protein S6 [bacterium]